MGRELSLLVSLSLLLLVASDLGCLVDTNFSVYLSSIFWLVVFVDDGGYITYAFFSRVPSGFICH